MRRKTKWVILMVLVMLVLGSVCILWPRFTEHGYDRALRHDRNGELDSAIRLYDQVIDSKPDWAIAHYKRGRAHVRAAAYDRAIEDLSKAIELQPDMEPAYYNRAVAYCSIKAYDKAWADVTTCQKLGHVVNPKFLDKLMKDSGRNQSNGERPL